MFVVSDEALSTSSSREIIGYAHTELKLDLSLVEVNRIIGINPNVNDFTNSLLVLSSDCIMHTSILDAVAACILYRELGKGLIKVICNNTRQ